MNYPLYDWLIAVALTIAVGAVLVEFALKCMDKMLAVEMDYDIPPIPEDTEDSRCYFCEDGDAPCWCTVTDWDKYDG